MSEKGYPFDVRVGDHVFVWNGDGFTKEEEVIAVDGCGGVEDNMGIWHDRGEWFYAPVKFDIPQRPKRRRARREVPVELQRVDVDLEHDTARVTVMVPRVLPINFGDPMFLTVEVPEEE